MMAIQSVQIRVANDLSVVMGRLNEARVVAMLAIKAEGLNLDDSRTVFCTLQSIMDEVHNDVDVAREMLEGQP